MGWYGNYCSGFHLFRHKAPLDTLEAPIEKYQLLVFPFLPEEKYHNRAVLLFQTQKDHSYGFPFEITGFVL